MERNKSDLVKFNQTCVCTTIELNVSLNALI